MHTKSLAFRNASPIRATDGHYVCEHVFLSYVCVCAYEFIYSATVTIIHSSTMGNLQNTLGAICNLQKTWGAKNHH